MGGYGKGNHTITQAVLFGHTYNDNKKGIIILPVSILAEVTSINATFAATPYIFYNATFVQTGITITSVAIEKGYVVLNVTFGQGISSRVMVIAEGDLTLNCS